MRDFIHLYRSARRHPAYRSEAIGMIITFGLFAVIAIGLAAITGDA